MEKVRCRFGCSNVRLCKQVFLVALEYNIERNDCSISGESSFLESAKYAELRKASFGEMISAS
jgi:hypothetical protein